MMNFLSKLQPFLPAFELTLSVLLIVCVLLQSRGASVGTAFGGTGTIYRTKRGLEKILLKATVVLGILFAATSLLRVTL